MGPAPRVAQPGSIIRRISPSRSSPCGASSSHGGSSSAALARRTGADRRKTFRDGVGGNPAAALEDNNTMRARSKKATPPVSSPSPDVPSEDRTALIGAYRAGLIVAWRRDIERGYCLTIAGRQDHYVEVTQLANYLRTLQRTA